MSEAIQTLLKRANEDVESAQLLKKARILNNSCMLSQQAVEKSLKALMIYRKKEVPMIHNIRVLIDILESGGKTKVPLRIKDTALSLTSAFHTTRYTDDEMTFSDVHEFTRIARFTLAWVSSIVK